MYHTIFLRTISRSLYSSRFSATTNSNSEILLIQSSRQNRCKHTKQWSLEVFSEYALNRGGSNSCSLPSFFFFYLVHDSNIFSQKHYGLRHILYSSSVLLIEAPSSANVPYGNGVISWGAGPLNLVTGSAGGPCDQGDDFRAKTLQTYKKKCVHGISKHFARFKFQRNVHHISDQTEVNMFTNASDVVNNKIDTSRHTSPTYFNFNRIVFNGTSSRSFERPFST